MCCCHAPTLLQVEIKIAATSSEHVSGAERQNFSLIAQLHLRESRSPLRSAHFTFKPAPLPLRYAVRSDLRGGKLGSRPSQSPPIDDLPLNR